MDDTEWIYCANCDEEYSLPEDSDYCPICCKPLESDIEVTE